MDTRPLVVDPIYASPDASIPDVAEPCRSGGSWDAAYRFDGVPPDLLPAQCQGICNARTPSYPKIFSGGGMGDVTEYATSPSSGGACNYGVTNIEYYAAMNVNVLLNDGKGQWQDGRICGQCVEVTALTSKGPKSVVVRIVDRCADEYCGIDLGGLAPAAVMADGFGRYEGAWRFVSCAGHPGVSDGPTVLYVKDGSNPYWSIVQVRNPPAPVESMIWELDSDPSTCGSLSYTGKNYAENFFQVPLEVLQSAKTYRLRIRYIDGTLHTLQLTAAQLAAAYKTYPLLP